MESEDILEEKSSDKTYRFIDGPQLIVGSMRVFSIYQNQKKKF
jgi:hypothetical protein